MDRRKFKPQRVKTKRGSTSGQTWEVDVGKAWISSQHQNVGGQVASDTLEKGLTRNTACSCWIALDTMQETMNCLKKMHRGVSRKRRSWATQLRAEVNKLELRRHLGRTWEKLLSVYFVNEMRAPSTAQPLMANPFIRTAEQLLFTWYLAGLALKYLILRDKLKFGDKGLHVYRKLMQCMARDDSGLSLARKKDATCFLRWIMSVIPDAAILGCYQKATKNKALEIRVSNVIQSKGNEKEGGSRRSYENHAKIDEIKRFSNQKFYSNHDVHRALAVTEG